MWREKPGFGPKVRTKFGLEGGVGGGRWAQLKLTDTKRLQKLG